VLGSGAGKESGKERGEKWKVRSCLFCGEIQEGRGRRGARPYLKLLAIFGVDVLADIIEGLVEGREKLRGGVEDLFAVGGCGSTVRRCHALTEVTIGHAIAFAWMGTLWRAGGNEDWRCACACVRGRMTAVVNCVRMMRSSRDSCPTLRGLASEGMGVCEAGPARRASSPRP
jgi:hypothetical protein